MNRMLLVPLLGLALASGGVEARQDPPNFRATISGHIISMEMAPPIATIDFVGEGVATHLGAYTALFPHTVNLMTLVEEGDMTLVASDNSTITIHLSGPS